MRTLRSLIVVALLLAIPVLVFAHTAADPYKVALLAGNPKTGIKVAGHAEIWDDGTNLHVTYFLDFAPYALEESHIAVAGPVVYDANGDIVPPTPDQIPQTKKLNPIPGQFPYGDGAGPFDIPISSWGVGTELYVVIHGKICRDVESIIAAIDDFPDTVKVDVNFSDDPNVYIEAIIFDDGFLNGTYEAYCIDEGNYISASYPYYTMDVSTNDLPNMDLVNWVINQDYIGEPSYYSGPEGPGLPLIGDYLGDYTNSDIQGAIWKLLLDISGSGTIQPPPDPLRVAEIVADAEANGEDYEPGCGDYLAVKLIPNPPGQGDIDPVQRILIKFPIDCDCQTIWGAEVDDLENPTTYAYNFPGDNWALYVTYTVQGASPAPPRMSLDSSVTTTWGSIKNR